MRIAAGDGGVDRHLECQAVEYQAGLRQGRRRRLFMQAIEIYFVSGRSILIRTVLRLYDRVAAFRIFDQM